jgi:uncharacterized protein with HEPN domain
LSHILEAIERIERYTSVGAEVFLAQSHWQDATIRQLEIIGEAVKSLSPETKALRPDVPWKQIAGMRDFLIHGYFGVDLQVVWVTAERDVPALRRAVEQLLARE